MTCQTIEMRHCAACGGLENTLALLIAIPRAFICSECVLIMADLIANKATEQTRIAFVEGMVAILEEPVKIVAKWKDVRSQQEQDSGTEG